MKTSKLRNPIRQILKWELFQNNDKIYFVLSPDGKPTYFNSKKEAEKFMLIQFYKSIDTKNETLILIKK